MHRSILLYCTCLCFSCSHVITPADPLVSMRDVNLNETVLVHDKQSAVYVPESPASSPEIIYLENPSFTGIPQAGATPKFWLNFGSKGESPPDIQPGIFGVTTPPKDGDTYLGLCYRNNQTHEAVGQELSIPLEKGERYTFSLWLASGRQVESLSRTTSREVQFTDPVGVQIVGFDDTYHSGLVLAQTEVVYNKNWVQYDFELKPKFDSKYLVVRCFNPHDSGGYGYVLVDHCSPIIRVKQGD